MDFDDYIKDRHFEFYGVCSNEFKLDDNVWEAIEDESDGYRSYMDSIVKIDSDAIFFSKSLAKVKVCEAKSRDFDGYEFIDIESGHIWLTIGTDNYDDYYPCFTFTYTPDKTKTF